jgi:hypothetical protein
VTQRQELFLLGSVINHAVAEPEKLKALLPRPHVQATGMIAIPKKRKREHG